jgi:hypothetical protein
MQANGNSFISHLQEIIVVGILYKAVTLNWVMLVETKQRPTKMGGRITHWTLPP